MIEDSAHVAAFASAEAPEILRAEGLSRRFGAVLANDRIDLVIRQGELHCLFGENGAGKSTLSACLYGYQRPDAGRIIVGGREVSFASPADAIACGIGMVHQHFVLVEPMTVLENVVLGTQKTGLRLSTTDARRKLAALCADFDIPMRIDAFIWQLSTGEQQWVEILKALFLDARILILDEPTAVLTPQESERLFALIRVMQSRGISIVIITHKMAEVLQTDRVTVLRKGRRIATVETAATTARELTELMIGREAPPPTVRGAGRPGEVAVEAASLTAIGNWGEKLVDEVSLTVRQGEILGVAGVAGNGQKPLLDLLAGVRRPHGGTIAVGGRRLEGQGSATFMAAGVGLIPEDRFAEGLIGGFSIAENVILGSQRSADLRRGMQIDRAKVTARAEKAMADYSIAARGIEAPVRELSGGNAQKVILARELAQARVLLLANQPTRGLDLGVVATVHERLLQKRAEGCAIILVSEDLGDLMSLCDRIAVMFAGRIVATLDAETADIRRIGALMAGETGKAA